MPSAVDIANIALSHIGADAVVTNLSPPDGSVESGHCARFYPIARKELIEYGNFSFAKRRTTLAEVTNPSEIWAYAYALPSDCVKPMRVLQQRYLSDVGLFLPLGGLLGHWLDWKAVDEVFTERGSADFEMETTETGSKILLTNEPEAVLMYKRDVTDTTKFTPLFTSALGMLLAGYVAGPIIKGADGARIGANWRQQGFAMADKAAAVDANAGSERAQHVAEHIRMRS